MRCPTCVMLAVFGASFTWAQAWEVVSVKPSGNNSAESNVDSTPGRLTATSVTVRELIRLAYGMKDYQIERAPGWIDGERFDIAAKSANKTTTLNELQSQVRELLAGRFQLATHFETKQMPVYLLVVGKGGAKLTAHNDGTGTKTRKGCGHLAGSRLAMDAIATILSRQLEYDVVNQTGLPGKYDFQLDWTPDSGNCEAGLSLPSIFTAVQQQLGLKLESGRGAVQTLIVDRVARPSEN